MTSFQGPEVDFALHTIGWKAFQDLACTICEVEFSRPVNRTSKTSDEGRDGSFYGIPEKAISEKDTRETSIQSKHSVKGDDSLTLSMLKEDISKARDLASSGRADGYILISNCRVTESNRRKITDALKDVGVLRPHVFGKEWVTAKILEHHSVRALVPRVYGLGDLAWIIDDRSKEQAKAILASLGGDLTCYVPTTAHQTAVKALLKHRVVLLLGEPAVGKSTIAAALAVAATDEAGTEVFYVRSPAEFLQGWDPNYPNRLFWIDDAFGSIQYQPNLSDEWNKCLTSLRAATRNGNRFILTSRNYIWLQAIRDLKIGTFPPLNDGQVVINVEELSLAEKEQILYNHLKFGNQPREKLKEIKSFLDQLVRSNSFRPEMARRLGDQSFTGNVDWSQSGIERFFKNAQDFLIETINGLEPAHRAALGLVFVSSGAISLPIEHGRAFDTVSRCFDVSLAQLNQALKALEESFFAKTSEQGFVVWKFKHPTIADAFSEIVAKDESLLELYLNGVQIQQFYNEATCGHAIVKGAKVEIPSKLFGLVIERMKKDGFPSLEAIRSFLARRCSAEFIKQFFADFEVEGIWEGHVYRPVARHRFADFILRMAEVGVLPIGVRAKFIEALVDQIENYADVDFLLGEPQFDQFLKEEEKEMMRRIINDEVIGKLIDYVNEEADVYDRNWDPEEHFADLIFQFEQLTGILPHRDDVARLVETARRHMDEVIEDLRMEQYEGEDSFENMHGVQTSAIKASGGRSIFEDLA